MANISNFIAKTQNAIGTVNTLKDFLPDSVRKPLDEFLYGTGFGGSTQKGLNKVISTLNEYNGVARNTHFYVTIPAPPAMTSPKVSGSNLNVPEAIPFLAESASLPGVMMATSSVKRYGIGPEEKKPYAPTFVDVNMTFIGDGNYYVHKFFYAWLNRIVVFAKDPATDNAFEVNYKTEYATTISISTLDETGRKVATVKLYGVYPIFMGDILLDWGSTDSFVKIPITFTYQRWELEVTDLDEVVPGSIGVVGALQKAMGIASAVQVLGGLRKPRNTADLLNVVNNSKIAIGGLRGIF